MSAFPKYLLLWVLLVAFPVIGLCQIEKPIAKLDTLTMRIGEQTKLKLTVNYRVDLGPVKLVWPEIKEVINERIHVVEASKVDTIMPNKEEDLYQFRQEQTLVITCFDSGYAAIPPFQFIANGDTTESDPLLLHVLTVEIDTAAEIKDIIEIYDIPFDFKKWLAEYWGWIAGGVGLVALTLFAMSLVRRFRKHKPDAEPEEVVMKEAAHVIAFRRLDELKLRKLWQAGQVKEYHSLLSEIVREYIENRYAVFALEQTTDEILRNTRHCEIPSTSRKMLASILFLSDMAKFAKAEPLPGENEQAMQEAYGFVGETQEKIVVEKDASTAIKGGTV